MKTRPGDTGTGDAEYTETQGNGDTQKRSG